VIVLLVLPWVVVFVSSRNHHLDVGTVGAIVAVSIGLPTLWISWASIRIAGRYAGLSLAAVADQLAVAVRAQWKDEASIRGLDDPCPLPVSWTAADLSLIYPWDLLVKLAMSGAEWPSPSPSGTWAAHPEDLAGKGGELADVLARVPTGRLIVLGEPGTGKTILMVRLVLELLARRAAGGPVPLLVSTASWNPADQDLVSWLGGQLLIDYPSLADTPAAGPKEATQATALLASGLILPVLDGLDEIPEQLRSSALSRINDALRPGEQVVVTCRSSEYRNAVRPQSGAGVMLHAAAAVELRPLDADAVRDYLCNDAGDRVAQARWDPVLAVLGTEAPAGQALRTPLMVGLARDIYNPRPGELVGTLRNPAELCGQPDRIAVEALLFDAFIPAAYRDDSAGGRKAAEDWLRFLARHLERKIESLDLAWWQLPLAVPFFAALATVQFVAWLGFGAGVVVAIVALAALLPGNWARVGVVMGCGLSIVVAALILVGSTGIPEPKLDSSSAASPSAVLIQNRRKAIRGGAVAGLVFGAIVGALTGSVAGAGAGALAAAGFGVVIGVLVSFKAAAWPSYTTARILLAVHQQLPWPLMDFLDDAHTRGVLRQEGAVYQFRHSELQHRLANRP
jgi:hypothetical protein